MRGIEKIRLTTALLSTLLLVLSSCSNSIDKPENIGGLWTAEIYELDDREYPDNPEIPLRHPAFGQLDLDSLTIQHHPDQHWTINFVDLQDPEQIQIPDIHLFDWIPTVPTWLEDDNLIQVCLQNQEFNRQQVQFDPDGFVYSGNPDLKISRVDVARNCLNAYLWELIVMAEDGDSEKLIYHGWFTFPEQLYRDMFEQRSGLSFEECNLYLEEWTDLNTLQVDVEQLRRIESSQELSFQNLQDSFPIQGERKKKFNNIIAPQATNSVSDFQNDEVVFATFSPPGYYDKSQPKHATLSSLANPNAANWNSIKHQNGQASTELEVRFTQEAGNDIHLYVGGLDFEQLPVLKPEDVNSGFQIPFGIGNHSFYEPYELTRTRSNKKNSNYVMLVDNQGQYIDNHDLGIDGVLMHWDSEEKDRLHLWILGFERHALVGHLLLEFSDFGEI
jgi:hypothetical protein